MPLAEDDQRMKNKMMLILLFFNIYFSRNFNLLFLSGHSIVQYKHFFNSEARFKWFSTKYVALMFTEIPIPGFRFKGRFCLSHHLIGTRYPIIELDIPFFLNKSPLE